MQLGQTVQHPLRHVDLGDNVKITHALPRPLGVLNAQKGTNSSPAQAKKHRADNAARAKESRCALTATRAVARMSSLVEKKQWKVCKALKH